MKNQVVFPSLLQFSALWAIKSFWSSHEEPPRIVRMKKDFFTKPFEFRPDTHAVRIFFYKNCFYGLNIAYERLDFVPANDLREMYDALEKTFHAAIGVVKWICVEEKEKDNEVGLTYLTVIKPPLGKTNFYFGTCEPSMVADQKFPTG